MSGQRDRPALRASGTCKECGAPLAGDQRYCLSCGVRCGARPPALQRILAGLPVGESPAFWGAGPPAGQPSPSGEQRRARGGLPGPRTAAVLVLAMLGFGAVTGAAASNPSGALNALRRGPLTLLVPPPSAPTHTLAAAPPPVEAAPLPETSSTEGSSEEPSEESSSSAGESHKHAHKGASKESSSGSQAPKLPPVKHVFLIVLADQAYAQTFGPESPAPYVAHTLEHRGELLVRFYGVAHEELADEVALISGLGPTAQTAANCPVFTDIIPGQANSKGQYTGDGCIYPTEAQTVGEQLTAKGLTWKVYAEGIGDVGAAAGVTSQAGGVAGTTGAASTKAGGETPCWHPEFGAADPTAAGPTVADPTMQAPPGDIYATFRNPFTYFDGVLHATTCAKNDVGIGALAHDLRHARSTPSFSYIVPDLCHDGRPTPCTPGAPSGLPAAETFLRRVVPEILAAPAYKHDGLLIITTDQAPTTGEYADSSSCCGQPRFPAPAPAVAPGASGPSAGAGGTSGTPGVSTGAGGASTTSTAPGSTATPPTPSPSSSSSSTTTPATGTPTATTPTDTTAAGAPINLPPAGGGQVGALLISRYVKAATFNQEPFNDFSLLRTIENLFDLPPLGYAATRGLSSLEAPVFSAWSGVEANSS